MNAILGWVISIGALSAFLLFVDKAVSIIEKNSPERVKQKPLTMDDDKEYWTNHSD